MNTKKIKVNLFDRPFTFLCSVFTSLIKNRHVDRNKHNLLSVMVRYTDKIYDMVRKKYRISDDWFIIVFTNYIIADRFKNE